MTQNVTYPLDSIMTLPQFLQSFERERILGAIRTSNYNLTQAARATGLTLRGLRYRLEKSGFQVRPTGIPRRMNEADREFSRLWPKLRMQALKQYKGRCQCCGATAKDGVTLHVDHVLPRKTHPELTLEPTNLQVLCGPCNMSKGFRDQTDWR